MPAQVLRRPRFLESLPAKREVRLAQFLRPGSAPSRPPPLRRVPGPSPEETEQPFTQDCISPPTTSRASVERLAAAIDLLELQAQRLAERARSALAELSEARVEVESGASLASDDVVVDTDFGTVDGRLTSRPDELRRAMDVSALKDVA